MRAFLRRANCGEGARREILLKSKKNWDRRGDDLAANLHDDDGIDPRRDRGRGFDRSEGFDRKVLQLCKEAARALEMTLACDCRDPILNDVEIVGVTPGGSANQLSVSVCYAGEDGSVDAEEVLARLSGVAGFLRAEVARAVNRRRVPELRFIVLPKGGLT